MKRKLTVCKRKIKIKLILTQFRQITKSSTRRLKIHLTKCLTHIVIKWKSVIKTYSYEIQLNLLMMYQASIQDVITTEQLIFLSYLMYKTNPPKNCLQLQYYGNTLAFSRAVIFHVPFIGWYSSSKEDRFYVENKKIFLDDIIYEIKFDNFTYKLIIAYETASFQSKLT